MYNEFEVVQYRFHIKKSNVLLIKGYFEEGCKKNNSLKVMLDQKELNVVVNEEINQGIALSREKILNNVWNYDYFGDARTIDTHVKKLRAKIGEKGEYIKTIWGVGYKFIVE